MSKTIHPDRYHRSVVPYGKYLEKDKPPKKGSAFTDEQRLQLDVEEKLQSKISEIMTEHPEIQAIDARLGASVGSKPPFFTMTFAEVKIDVVKKQSHNPEIESPKQ